MTIRRGFCGMTRMERMRLAVRVALSGLARILSPGYSYCYCCKMPWRFAQPHVTHFTDDRGCFPLCEFCWRILRVPRERLAYYRALFDAWPCDKPKMPETWTQIRTAVYAGK